VLLPFFFVSSPLCLRQLNLVRKIRTQVCPFFLYPVRPGRYKRFNVDSSPLSRKTIAATLLRQVCSAKEKVSETQIKRAVIFHVSCAGSRSTWGGERPASSVPSGGAPVNKGAQGWMRVHRQISRYVNGEPSRLSEPLVYRRWSIRLPVASLLAFPRVGSLRTSSRALCGRCRRLVG